MSGFGGDQLSHQPIGALGQRRPDLDLGAGEVAPDRPDDDRDVFDDTGRVIDISMPSHAETDHGREQYRRGPRGGYLLRLVTGDEAGSRRLGYEPSLDGLRALAVGAVLLFHGGVAGAAGGFLGVSVFFTLSGFLITLLLLRERDATGRVGLRSFWSRRVRRLSPAAMTCVATVLATAARWLDPVQLRKLPGDSLAALANVANWRYVLDDRSYADLFATGPSPLVHFWSLAIEEQFYLVFPIIMVALLHVRARRWVAPAVLAALALASVAATLATKDHDLVYYGTHTRAAEFLVGALLAFVVAGGHLERLGGRGRTMASAAGWLAIGMFAVLVVTVDQSTPWLYVGGFSALAVVWATMIVAALVPGSFRRVAGVAALAWIGRLSYGLYLIHWPVFMALDADRVGVDGGGLFAFRIVVSVGLTVLLYHLLEQPIRRRRLLPTMRNASMIYGLTLVCLVAASILVVQPGSAPSVAADVPDGVIAFSGEAPTGAGGAPSTPPAVGGPTSTPAEQVSATTAPSTPVRVLVVGSDASVVERLEHASHGQFEVIDAVRPGCPLSITEVEINDPGGPWGDCTTPDHVVDTVHGTPGVEVTVVAIGTAERARLDRLGGEDALTRDESVRTSYYDGVSAVADALTTLDGEGYRLVFLDAVANADIVSRLVDVAAIRAGNSSVGDYTASDDDLVQTIVAAAHPAGGRSGTRVLVTGDSTSYAVAVALAAVAADRYDVVWAGQSNCPLSPAYETRWWGDVTFRVDDCPSVEHLWPDVVDSFRPDVILAIASLPELAEQRYDAADVWHVPGDDTYLDRHDAAGASLASLAARSGAVLLLADAPPFGPNGFGGGPLGQPDRLAAWNAVLHGWADRWAMMRVVPYAELLGATELAAGGTLRPDGAHLVPEGAESLVRDGLVPALPGWIAEARATMTESGCLVERSGGPPLDLTACDRSAGSLPD